MPIVHEHRDRFDDRNLVLQVLLGLLAVSRRYEDWLLAYGPAGPAPSPSASGDVVLDLTLGAVAVSQHLQRRVSALTGHPGSAGGSPAARTAHRVGAELSDLRASGPRSQGGGDVR